jgi:hypothetical protein
MTVVRFPFAVSRRAYARRPRKSKNGTPEERAAKKAASTAEIVSLRLPEPEVEPKSLDLEEQRA